MPILCSFSKAFINFPWIQDIAQIGNGAKILCYHGVEKKINDQRIQIAHITLDRFERQIDYLRNNYDIISMDYLCDCLKNGKKLESRQVCISFDDGYKNNLYEAAPLLATYKLPFSVFLSTKHISDGDRLPTYYLRSGIYYTEKEQISFPSIGKKFNVIDNKDRKAAVDKIIKIVKKCPQSLVNAVLDDCFDLMPKDKWSEINNLFTSEDLMNWHEVKKIKNLGATIGSHCHDHSILHSGQKKNQIDCQVSKSKRLIEKYISSCKYISYPNGSLEDISPYALVSIKQHKYSLALTLISGLVNKKSNPYFLPRIWAPPEFEVFKYALNIKSILPGILKKT